MSDKKTLSQRVPESDFEMIKDLLSETELFETQSDFTRFSQKYVADEIFDRDIDDQQYQLIKKEIHERDFEQFYDGMERYFGGLIMENNAMVEEGVREINGFDEKLGEKASRYADKFRQTCW